MNNGNLFVICILCFYIKYILVLIFAKSRRKNIIIQNEELEKLRVIKNKTLEEQLKFITLKAPKTNGFKGWKFSWKWLYILILKILTYIIIYYTLSKTFTYFKFNISLFWGIMFLIGFPIILNFFLKKMNLNNNN